MVKTHLNFQQELKLNLFYILILKLIGMLCLSGMLYRWKLSVYSLNRSKSHEEKLKCITTKESCRKKLHLLSADQLEY